MTLHAGELLVMLDGRRARRYEPDADPVYFEVRELPPPETGTCVCGTLFEKKRSDQLYCSTRCGGRVRQRRHREARKCVRTE